MVVVNSFIPWILYHPQKKPHHNRWAPKIVWMLWRKEEFLACVEDQMILFQLSSL
jgi:hypothetical protein